MPPSSQTDEGRSYERQLDAPLSLQVFSLTTISGRDGSERNSPANRRLASVIMCRAPEPDSQIARLCHEKGADADMNISVAKEGDQVEPYGLLTIAIDGVDSPVCVLNVNDKELRLFPWPSRETQRKVLEALIANGADVNRGNLAPLAWARDCANPTAVEVLLKAKAAVRGLQLGYLPPRSALPPSPGPQYYSSLLDVYRRLFDHDRTLATEQLKDSGATPMHMAASRSLPSEFMRSYLDLLAQHGASLTAKGAKSVTPLDFAVMAGAPSAVEWLCERLVREEINKRNGQDLLPIELAGVHLSYMLNEKRPDEIDRLKQVVRLLLQHGASPDHMRTHNLVLETQQARSLVSDIQREMSQRPPSSSPSPRCLPSIIECPPPSAPQQQQQQQLSAEVKQAAQTAKTMAKKESKKVESTNVSVVKKASFPGGSMDTIGFVFEITGLHHTQWAAAATDTALQTALSAGRAVVDGLVASPVWAELVRPTDPIDPGKRMQAFLRQIADSVANERAARGVALPHAPPQPHRPVPLTTALTVTLALIKTDTQLSDLIRPRQPEERFALRQLRAASQATCGSAGSERVGLSLEPHGAFGSADLPVVWAGAVGFEEVTEACISMFAILLGGLSEHQRLIIKEAAETRARLLQDASNRSTSAGGGLLALPDTHSSQSGAAACASTSSSSSAAPPPLPPSAHDGPLGKNTPINTTTTTTSSNQPQETEAAGGVGRLADEGITGGRRGSRRHRQSAGMWMPSQAMDGETSESPTRAHSLLVDTMASSSSSAGPFLAQVGDTRPSDAAGASTNLKRRGSKGAAQNGVGASHLEQVESLLGQQGFSLARFDIYCEAPTATSTDGSRELLCRTMCRTLTGGEVWRLCRERGADAQTAIRFSRQPVTVLNGEGKQLIQLLRPARVSVLWLAVDDEFDSHPALWSAVTQHLKLPTWPSRRVQRDVLEALVKCGADVNEGAPYLRPLNVAHMMANVTATEVLLESGAAVRDEGDGAPLVKTSDGARRISSALAISFVPRNAAPSHPTPAYETALLEVYRRLFEYEPTLASGRFSGFTAMHRASQAPPGLSAAFMRGYLDLLAANGASLDARTDDGNSPLRMAAYFGGPPVVEWLCQRLGPDEINSEDNSAEALVRTALGAAAHRLAEQLSEEGTPPEKIDRQRQIIRTLLRYGADIGLLPNDNSSWQYARNLVLEIQQGMQQSAAKGAGGSDPSGPSVPSTAPSTSRSGAPIDEDARQPSSSSADTSAAAAAPAASASASVPSTAERWKSTGNALFLADKYLDAYRSYLKGIRAEREYLAELLIRRSQCLIGLESYLSAFIDVTAALRILLPPHSIEPGTKYAILQEIAMIVYKPLIAQLTGAAYNDDDQDVDLPSKGAIAALMTDAMVQLCSTDRPVVQAPQQVTDALTEGAALQGVESYADARGVFTAGLAAADVSTLVALLSNAAACLLQPKLVKEGGPDAVGCAAAAFHLSCLKGPCQQLSAIQQKTLIRLGQGLLAERLFDAADAVVQALTNHGLEGQMAADVTTLQRRIRTHAANARGDYDWAAIYRQAMGSAQNRQLGRTTLIDVGEYVGPVGFSPPAPDSQPSVVATQDVQPGQLLIVQRPVVVERASSQDSGRFDERLVARLASQCDVWHPRLVSQLCCLPPSRGQPSAIGGPPAPETCLELPPAYFPLVPRFIWSATGEEFGPPVTQIDSAPDHLRRLLDFKTHIAYDIGAENSLRGMGVACLKASRGVWPLASLLSHGGLSRNAIWYILEEGDLIVVRAVRPIARGNEVTVSYWDPLFTTLAAERLLARRFDLPDSPNPYSPLTVKVIEQVEKRLQMMQEKPDPGEETLREVDEMLQQVRRLNVRTILVAKLLAYRSPCLFAAGRVTEAVAATRESVATSRALLSYDIHDIGQLAVVLSSPQDLLISASDREEALTEIKKSCEVIFGTAEAFHILCPRLSSSR
ncbi:unnamed protein product [Vitrella brassicaformis CCMP3155]|uniref:SET domain-containing protein n=2 Tax=Vitrella brassicaformis TaxID=1169539 RepID=A0A0G4FTQ0_VITBC|nr:unnamed protein product [Vitrella brassicaformis CCMP3155]|eukprot:CEM18269.1 unnamed protein product [Vitrella brassicaformis CCMP3155]